MYDLRDCFQITVIDNVGCKQTHLVAEVVLHGPGGNDKRVTKADLTSSIMAHTLRDKLSTR